MTTREFLKISTADQHREIESHLNLMDPQINLESYASYLKHFYQFYVPYESAVSNSKLTIPELEWNLRKKSQLLRNDLEALGVACPTASREIPHFDSNASLLGSLYVTEGSTLGSQFICAHVKKNLGLSKNSGLSYFCGYEEKTSPMWKKLIEILEENVRTDVDRDRALSSAKSTFALLGKNWSLRLYNIK